MTNVYYVLELSAFYPRQPALVRVVGCYTSLEEAKNVAFSISESSGRRTVVTKEITYYDETGQYRRPLLK
jgi:hypothetical protein